ncbi:competence protein CoiA family protein [Nonomuraea sp. ATR24]|uniref:competence protein CoiA family protein n=1 Tax=Nonomuraea sp. ATR24 TaxID=1676744 RepID=UPI0035C1A294
MQEDTRRVQTAVLNGASSYDPILMPLDRTEALRFREHHDRMGNTFWCGTHLGGCGKQLMDRIGQVKIPHFAHHAHRAAHMCRRVNLGVDSADHLYIHQELSKWLMGLGMKPISAPAIDDDFALGGDCTALTVTPPRQLPLIAVQLVGNEHSWYDRDSQLRVGGRVVQWIFGTKSRASHAALDRDGYALRVRCETQGSTRRASVAVQLPGRPIEWEDISGWQLTQSGISTAEIERVRRPHTSLIGTGQVADTNESNIIGFPLDVAELVVTPKASKTGPWQHLGNSQNDSQSLPVKVQMRTGVSIGDAVVVLPCAYAELALGQLYQIMAPASIRANIDPERLTPRWIIDSGGLALAPAIQTPLLTPHVDIHPRVFEKQHAMKTYQEEVTPPEAREPLTTFASVDQSTAQLDRREEMRIRESAAKAITRLEQARSVGNRNRGRELLDQLGRLLKSAPSDKFGYELRQYGEYSAWLTPARKKSMSKFGRGR